MANYGALPSKTDVRDYKVKASTVNVSEFELTDLPPVKNQGTVGSCTAHATSSILEWFNKKETGEHRELSVGFIYGMQGVEFNYMGSGMYLRDACKLVQKYGDCLHETVPYNTEMPKCYEKLREQLDDEIYKEAAICKVSSYAKCQTENDVKYALMNYGPVLMSVKWYGINMVKFDGTISFQENLLDGYHAIMVYGFNEKGWLCQNSHGKLWGNGGRFILPYKHGFREAWSFVDAENSDVHKPKRNTVLDFLYKIINFIANLFSKNARS